MSIYQWSSTTPSTDIPEINWDNEKLQRQENPDGYEPKRKHLLASLQRNNVLQDNKTRTRTTWSLNSCAGGITTQKDRSTVKVQNLKRHAFQPGETIAYTGRADSKQRIIEQITFILNQEINKRGVLEDADLGNIPGMRKTSSEEWQFTYAINSLTKLGLVQSPTALDEKKAMDREMEALGEADHITYRGKKILLNPIHMHFDVSFAAEAAYCLLPSKLSGKSYGKTISSQGLERLAQYNTLCKPAASKEEQQHEGLRLFLKDKLQANNLTLREKFIYSDLYQRASNLLIVNHCKSSVDRAGAALALSSTNAEFFHQFLKDPDSIPKVIDEQRYKKAFLAHLYNSHEMTKVAREQYDEGTRTFNKSPHLGLKMKGSLISSSLPDSLAVKTIWNRSKAFRITISIIATIAYAIFYLPIVASMISIGHLALFLASKKWKNLSNYHTIAYRLTPWNLYQFNNKKIMYNHKELTRKDYNIFAHKPPHK